ncbi:MAG: hypothetical protein CMJ40_01890 [Phycisphaerae bacterium]|nr:hypothetical protein [Phycisphaerae bacterium]
MAMNLATMPGCQVWGAWPDATIFPESGSRKALLVSRIMSRGQGEPTEDFDGGTIRIRAGLGGEASSM